MSGCDDPRCQAARVWISAAADDEATDAERSALAAHLAVCSECRRWEALAGSLALRIRTAEPVVPVQPVQPVEAFELAPVVLFPARRQRRRSMRTTAAAVAVAGMAAMAGMLVSSSTRPNGIPSAQETRQIVLADRSPGFVDGVVVGLNRTTPPPLVGRNKRVPDDRTQQRP